MPLPGPDDITTLILDDHNTFRRAFAALDDVQRDFNAQQASVDDLVSAWQPLAELLDLHAAAEETVFYPQLLKKADEDGSETEDAIEDHNDIRDGVAKAAGEQVGSQAWWDAVMETRKANDEHMGEEEHEGLMEFRLKASLEDRSRIGQEFTAYKLAHPNAKDLGAQGEDKDPQDYIETYRPS